MPLYTNKIKNNTTMLDNEIKEDVLPTVVLYNILF